MIEKNKNEDGKKEKILKIVFNVFLVLQILVFIYSIYVGASGKVFDKTKLVDDEIMQMFFRNYVLVIRLQIVAMLLMLSAIFLKFWKNIFVSIVVIILTVFIFFNATAIPVKTIEIEKNDVEPKEVFYDNKNIFECL